MSIYSCKGQGRHFLLSTAHPRGKTLGALLCSACTFQSFNNRNILWWNNVIIFRTFQEKKKSSTVTACAWKATQDLDKIYSINSSLCVKILQLILCTLYLRHLLYICSSWKKIPPLLLFQRFLTCFFFPSLSFWAHYPYRGSKDRACCILYTS